MLDKLISTLIREQKAQMKIVLFALLSIALFGCISIYKDDITTSDDLISPASGLHQVQLEIGDEEFNSESVNKISLEVKEKIKNQIDLNITNSCINSKQLKSIKVSYFTSYQSDACWLFNLCYLVWPAINNSTHAIKFRINNLEEHLFDEKIIFKQYAHLILLPALIFKPFDTRKNEAFIKLADTFSKKLCNP